MIFQESETVEFKRIVTEDIKKEIIAFANSNGGKLYVGIEDDGMVSGIAHPDETALQISNMIRDAIKPDITMFIHYETLVIQDKSVVCVEIQRGTERPYYLTKKGLRPQGVYVRQGYSSVPATDTAIRQMIKETDGDHFEDRRSLIQDLSFDYAQKSFKQRDLDFGLPQQKTLGIINSDDIYTNLGLLLSDQCVHTIKVASFAGNDQDVFQDRREFSGSLLEQLDAVYSYIDLHNNTRATFNGLLRTDIRDYNEAALREALLNSLVHRDYSFSASTLISIYDDRIEFVSVGGLLAGISLDDVMMGLSICRNSKLANVFYRLELIEAYGTGIRKIINAYKDSYRKPLIEATTNAFKIVLPNLNEYPADVAVPPNNPSKEFQVIQLLRSKNSVTRKDIEFQLNMGQSSAARLLKKMVDSHLIQQQGVGRNTYYVLRNQ